jgi:hypothetical protein
MLAEDLGNGVQAGKVVKSGVDPTLDVLRQKVQEKMIWLGEYEKQERLRLGIPSLEVRYTFAIQSLSVAPYIYVNICIFSIILLLATNEWMRLSHLLFMFSSLRMLKIAQSCIFSLSGFLPYFENDMYTSKALLVFLSLLVFAEISDSLSSLTLRKPKVSCA